MAEDRPTRGRISFVDARDARTVAVSGIFGGLNAANQVVAQFYVEKGLNPKDTLVEVDQKSGQVHEVSRVGDRDESGAIMIVREIQSTVVVSPEMAFYIGQWFVEQARAAGFAIKSSKEQH
jgi:hypothetical protein